VVARGRRGESAELGTERDAMLDRLAGAMRLAALGDDRTGKPVHHHVVGCWVRTVQAIREALKVARK
jgi:hypothetical protein